MGTVLVAVFFIRTANTGGDPYDLLAIGFGAISRRRMRTDGASPGRGKPCWWQSCTPSSPWDGCGSTRPETDAPMKESLVLKNRLKEARAERGLSQTQLAEMVGVSRNTISSIETGQFSPTAKLALVICIALDKKFEDLFYF